MQPSNILALCIGSANAALIMLGQTGSSSSLPTAVTNTVLEKLALEPSVLAILSRSRFPISTIPELVSDLSTAVLPSETSTGTTQTQIPAQSAGSTSTSSSTPIPISTSASTLEAQQPVKPLSESTQVAIDILFPCGAALLVGLIIFICHRIRSRQARDDIERSQGAFRGSRYDAVACEKGFDAVPTTKVSDDVEATGSDISSLPPEHEYGYPAELPMSPDDVAENGNSSRRSLVRTPAYRDASSSSSIRSPRLSSSPQTPDFDRAPSPVISITVPCHVQDAAGVTRTRTLGPHSSAEYGINAQDMFSPVVVESVLPGHASPSAEEDNKFCDLGVQMLTSSYSASLTYRDFGRGREESEIRDWPSPLHVKRSSDRRSGFRPRRQIK